MSMTSGLPDAVARVSAAEMNQHFEEDFVLAKDLGDLEEFANEVLRKTTASG